MIQSIIFTYLKLFIIFQRNDIVITNVNKTKNILLYLTRGKNVKTSYDVVPPNLDLEVKHESLLLKTNFQVEGFTVQGRVKDLAGATILVNGKVEAVSKSDGTFSLPRMKPGTYNFEVQSDKFQFDPKKIEVTASNPELPDFTPSRFQVCGVIKGKELLQSGQPLKLNIQSITGNKNGDIRQEVV